MYNNKDNSHYRWKNFISWHAVAAICFFKKSANADGLDNFYQLNNLGNPLTEALNNFKESGGYLPKNQFAKLIIAKQNAKASKMDVLKNEHYLPDQYIPPYFSSANPDFLFNYKLSSLGQGVLGIELPIMIAFLSIFKSVEDIVYNPLRKIEIPLEFTKNAFSYKENIPNTSKEFDEEFFSNTKSEADYEKQTVGEKTDSSEESCNIPDGFAKPAICFLTKEWQHAYDDFVSSPFTFRGMASDRIDAFAEVFEAAWGWANSWFGFDWN
jgi:hypothetical protein